MKKFLLKISNNLDYFEGRHLCDILTKITLFMLLKSIFDEYSKLTVTNYQIIFGTDQIKETKYLEKLISFVTTTTSDGCFFNRTLQLTPKKRNLDRTKWTKGLIVKRKTFHKQLQHFCTKKKIILI